MKVNFLRTKGIFSHRSTAIMLMTLLTLAITGLFTLREYNLLPSNLILESSFFLAALIIFKKPKKFAFAFMVTSISYITISFFIAKLFNVTNSLDFLQAFKAFIYVPALCMFFGKELFTGETIYKVFKVLAIIFIIKYLLSVFFGFNNRPGVYTENNFELLMLVLFYYLSHRTGNANFLDFLILSIIVMASGSRSAALCLLVVFACVNFRKFDLKFILGFILAPLLGLMVYYIFMSRMTGSLEDIDRYRFLLIFLDEIKNWPWYKFILGSYPLTPLQDSSCMALSYYSTLFSYENDGSCYSVIFHSYIMRVIFDHGLAGLFFLTYFIYSSFNRSGYKRIDSACVIGVLLASGLSVSSFNSIFSAITIALFLSIKKYEIKNEST